MVSLPAQAEIPAEKESTTQYPHWSYPALREVMGLWQLMPVSTAREEGKGILERNAFPSCHTFPLQPSLAPAACQCMGHKLAKQRVSFCLTLVVKCDGAVKRNWWFWSRDIDLCCQQIIKQDAQNCRSLSFLFNFFPMLVLSKHDCLMIQLQIHIFTAAGTRQTP